MTFYLYLSNAETAAVTKRKTKANVKAGKTTTMSWLFARAATRAIVKPPSVKLIIGKETASGTGRLPGSLLTTGT